MVGFGLKPPPPPCHLLTHHTLSSVWSVLRSIISLWQLRFWYFFHKIILIPLEFSLQGAVKDNMEGGGLGIFFLIPLTLTTLKGHMFLMVIRRHGWFWSQNPPPPPPLSPSHPIISRWVCLFSILFSMNFLEVLSRRICVTIKSFLS